jgi:hypothetical protein
MNTVALLETVDSGNVRMIERSQHTGFAFESCATIAVEREDSRENLDRDLPTEFEIPGTIDVAHPARPQQVLEGIRPQLLSCEGAAGRSVPEDRGCYVEGGLVQKARPSVIVRNQRLHFAAQLSVVAACLADVPVAIAVVGQPERIVVQPFNPLPSIGDVRTA